MRSKLFVQLSLTVLLLSVVPGFSQTVPEAYENHSSFYVGGGASNFDMDWGHTRMYGGTLWAGWRPGKFSRFIVDGLGLEIEARDIDWDRPKLLPKNFRQDTLGGGATYTWNHLRYIRPYARGMIEYGSFDYALVSTHLAHANRTVYAPAFGLEFRTLPHLWVRTDYEYQVWQQLFGKYPDPQGFTVGAIYDFSGFRRRQMH